MHLLTSWLCSMIKASLWVVSFVIHVQFLYWILKLSIRAYKLVYIYVYAWFYRYVYEHAFIHIHLVIFLQNIDIMQVRNFTVEYPQGKGIKDLLSFRTQWYTISHYWLHWISCIFFENLSICWFFMKVIRGTYGSCSQ